MECPRCNYEVEADDNFCRKCGYILGEPRALVPAAPPLPPVDWRPVRDLVIRGATALVLGTAAELLRRQAQQHLSPSALADRVEGLTRRQAPIRREPARLPVRVVKPAPAQCQPAAEEEPGMTIIRYVFYERIRIRR